MRAFLGHLSWGKLGLVLALLGAQLLVLKALPYSRSKLVVLDDDEARTATSSLTLDGLTWDAASYRTAPSLDPIRQTVRQHCPDLGGYETATCLTKLFAARFPYGAPRKEFVDRDHDPAAVFQAHMGGASGHCVTRSGMLAVALLSTGHPARVVQILAREVATGHNVVEVWDGTAGWRLVDPLFAGTMDTEDGNTAAVALAVGTGNPRWRPDDSLWTVPGVNQAGALEHYSESRLRGAMIIYPDPWLYTRVGQPAASWPFSSRFVMVGARSLRVGWSQQALQIGIVIACLGLVVVLVFDAARLFRLTSRQVRSERRRAVQSTS